MQPLSYNSNPEGHIPDLEIKHSTFIHSDPLSIYEALTTSTGLDSWFTNGSTVNAIPGGEIHFHWQNWGPDHITTDDGGPVLEAEPPTHFVFQWHPDRSDDATTVEINIEAAEGGTIVTLREHGYAATPSALKAMINCATGWGEALTLLKFYLEYGLHY
jgi:uncharacterized protein YndB with AHSA1/START domain